VNLPVEKRKQGLLASVERKWSSRSTGSVDVVKCAILCIRFPWFIGISC